MADDEETNPPPNGAAEEPQQEEEDAGDGNNNDDDDDEVVVEEEDQAELSSPKEASAAATAGSATAAAAAAASTNIDVDLSRPKKKARTGYIIFCADRRQELAAENPEQAKTFSIQVAGTEWRLLDEAVKARYNERSKEEKEQVEAYNAAYDKAVAALGKDSDRFTLEAGPGAGTPSGTPGPLDLVYPNGKIRKICKLDPEVKNVSNEAIRLITKAAELFTVALGKESVKVARFNNRRKLLPEDVAHVCVHREAYTFLKDDVKDLVKWQREAARKEKKQKEIDAAAAAAAATSVPNENHANAAAAGSKPLTDYFSASTSK